MLGAHVRIAVKNILSVNQCRLYGSRLINTVSSVNPPKVLVPVTDGSDFTEVTTIRDALTIAGAEVVLVATFCNDVFVVCNDGTKLKANGFIREYLSNKYDMIACPGGIQGITNFGKSYHLTDLLSKHRKAGKFVAAMVEAPAEVLLNNTEDEVLTTALEQHPYGQNKVHSHDNIITAQGSEALFPFALKLVEELFDKTTAMKVKKELKA